MGEEAPKRQRKSLRNSVLKHPSRDQPRSIDPYQKGYEEDNFGPRGGLFKGFGPMFNMDEDGFSPFGFGGFGHLDRFGEHFNEMMSRFFSDFQPESFADSQYYGEDRDLDEDVSRRGLDRALEQKPEFDRSQFFSGGFSHSESMIRRPDGTTEKRVTHKDLQGNTQTTVTVTHPDGTQETTTSSRDSGGGGVQDNIVISDFDVDRFPTQGGKGLFENIFENWKRFF